jgi:hypothetical protein
MVDTGASFTGERIGVNGQATGITSGQFKGDGDGVQGHGAGGFSGVAGFGDTGGTGVYGQGGTNACGVRGYGGNPPDFQGPSPAGNPVGVFGRAGATGDGVQGLASGSGSSGVAGFGGSEGGTGVLAQAGTNGGVGLLAVSSGIAHIRMLPTDLRGNGPNTAKVPGAQGDLLAVSGFGGAVASLWFNVNGSPTGWSHVQGGLPGVDL